MLGFPGGSEGKESTAMQETQVQSLDREDPLEEGMDTPTPVFLPGEFHRGAPVQGVTKRWTQLSD